MNGQFISSERIVTSSGYLLLNADNLVLNNSGTALTIPSNARTGDYLRVINTSASTVDASCENSAYGLIVNGSFETSVSLPPGSSFYGVFDYDQNVNAHFFYITTDAGAAPTLPIATATTTGVVMIPTDGGLTVAGDGSVVLNAAHTNAIGGVKVAVNSGLTLDSNTGALSFNAGTNLTVDANTGAVSVGPASAVALGGVLVTATSGLTNVGGAISVAPAQVAQVGGVKVPAASGLTVDGAGTLGVNLGSGMAIVSNKLTSTRFFTSKPYVPSAPYAAGDIIFYEYLPAALTIPAGATGSKFAFILPTGSPTTAISSVNIMKNGVSVGSISFPVTASTGSPVLGTISVASAVSFAAGDSLSLVVAANPDANFTGVFGTFVGTFS
jgi:hypothetical protein